MTAIKAFRLPTKDERGRVPVELRNASESVRRMWDATHQRDIDAVQPRLPSYGWRWSRGAFGAELQRVLPVSAVPLPIQFITTLPDAFSGYAAAAEMVAQAFLQQPCCLVLVNATSDVALAMALVCDSFVDDAHFLWLLSGVPASTLAKSYPSAGGAPGLIGLGMLWAIAERAVRNAQGREPKGLLLHASPEGGDKLMKWYQCAGMTPIPAGVRLSLTRESDGRYLRFSASEAEAFVSKWRKEFQ